MGIQAKNMTLDVRLQEAGRVEVGTARKALEKLHRLACICISATMRSCFTGATEVLLATLYPEDIHIVAIMLESLEK